MGGWGAQGSAGGERGGVGVDAVVGFVPLGALGGGAGWGALLGGWAAAIPSAVLVRAVGGVAGLAGAGAQLALARARAGAAGRAIAAALFVVTGGLALLAAEAVAAGLLTQAGAALVRVLLAPAYAIAASWVVCGAPGGAEGTAMGAAVGQARPRPPLLLPGNRGDSRGVSVSLAAAEWAPSGGKAGTRRALRPVGRGWGRKATRGARAAETQESPSLFRGPSSCRVCASASCTCK